MSFLSQLLGEIPEEEFEDDYFTEEPETPEKPEEESEISETSVEAPKTPVEKPNAHAKLPKTPVETPEKPVEKKEDPGEDFYNFSGSYPKNGKKILSISSAFLVSVTYEIVIPMILKSHTYREKIKKAIEMAEKTENPS